MYLHKSIIFILLILSSSFIANAQNAIKGIVVDASTNERLAFVNIVINDNVTLGTTTDIDGYFNINSRKKIEKLTMSYIGYETRTIQVDNTKDSLYVRMRPTEFVLSEIVIDGKNNPAHRIIDSAIYYRNLNNIDNLDSYYYKIYDNMIFTLDTTELDIDDILHNELKDNDLMAMETVSEQFFKRPNKKKKNILANKVSGFKNPMFIYLLEGIQSIGFYEDFVTINGKKYINPISKGSKDKYIFVLESSFKDEYNDSIFTISFRPYKKNSFNSLNGTITINSDSWSIQNVKAEPTEQDNLFDINIQQLYEKKNGLWFPKQLNTNIRTPFTDGQGAVEFTLLGIGKSYISEIETNKEIGNDIFDNADYSISEDASNSDDIIKAYRYEQLSEERLEATYEFIDSISLEMGVSLDKVMNAFSSLMSNEIPIGMFNLRTDDILNYNIGNGFMFGLGLNTNKRVSRIFSIYGFGSYWCKAKEFNYGGDISFNIMRSKDMQLRFSIYNKFERLGNYGFSDNRSVLNINNYKNFYINATSLNKMASAEYSTYINKHIRGSVKFEVGDKTIFNYQDLSNNYHQSYRLSNLDFKLRIAFKEKFIKTSEGLKKEGSANPAIWLSYQKNLKDIFNSPYNFDKIEFMFSGKKEFKYWGETSISIQAGLINGTIPVCELFNIEGNHLNRFDFLCTESFNTMQVDEFFCDRFAALYFSHNFKNTLLNFRRFHPEIILVTNIAWGDTDNKVIPDTFKAKRMDKGYFESGLIIDNLVRITFMKIGLGAFYRYGAYSYDKIIDNLVFKIKIGFSI